MPVSGSCGDADHPSSSPRGNYRGELPSSRQTRRQRREASGRATDAHRASLGLRVSTRRFSLITPPGPPEASNKSAAPSKSKHTLVAVVNRLGETVEPVRSLPSGRGDEAVQLRWRRGDQVRFPRRRPPASEQYFVMLWFTLVQNMENERARVTPLLSSTPCSPWAGPGPLGCLQWREAELRHNASR